jgi:hypothetical protein
LFFGGTEVEIQGLTLAWQALYHLNPAHSLCDVLNMSLKDSLPEGEKPFSFFSPYFQMKVIWSDHCPCLKGT